MVYSYNRQADFGGYHLRKHDYVCRGFPSSGEFEKDEAEAIYTGEADIRDLRNVVGLRQQHVGTWWWNVKSASWADVTPARDWARVQEGLGTRGGSVTHDYFRAMSGEPHPHADRGRSWWPMKAQIGIILVGHCPEHWRFDEQDITEAKRGERVKLIDIWYSGKGWHKASANITVRT